LSDSETVERVVQANELLSVLKSIRHQDWQYIVTVDESWFYFIIDWETQWFPEEDEPATRMQKTIDHRKMMVTIVWNLFGFHVVDILPQGETFSA
jgi:hypothetical protein